MVKRKCLSIYFDYFVVIVGRASEESWGGMENGIKGGINGEERDSYYLGSYVVRDVINSWCCAILGRGTGKFPTPLKNALPPIKLGPLRVSRLIARAFVTPFVNPPCHSLRATAQHRSLFLQTGVDLKHTKQISNPIIRIYIYRGESWKKSVSVYT